MERTKSAGASDERDGDAIMSKFAQSAVCVNIGRRERQKRLAVGLGMFALGIGLAVVLIHVSVPRWLRLGLFVPFWFGILGVFQALKSTCVMLAARGVRHLDVGEEAIEDQTLKQQLRGQARSIHIMSAFIALVLTVLCLVW